MKKFFSDKGTNDVPDEYLIAVEMGLRSFGSDRYAFGTFAMDTEEEWHKRDLIWRKRECYIAMARHVLGLGGYGKYIHFRWDDFLSRSNMTKTFNKRHLPYSMGEDTLDGLVDPPEWSNGVTRRKRKRYAVTEMSPSSVDSVGTPTSTAAMAVWDSEEDKWVES